MDPDQDVLRHPGRLLAPGEFVPPAVVDFIGRQLDLDLDGDDLADYAPAAEPLLRLCADALVEAERRIEASIAERVPTSRCHRYTYRQIRLGAGIITPEKGHRSTAHPKGGFGLQEKCDRPTARSRAAVTA